MEHLKFSLFDTFAYFLPGTIVLSGLVIFVTPEYKTVLAYIEMFYGINIGLAIVLIVVSYVIGNVSDHFGSWLYYKVGCKIWGNPYPQAQHSKLSHAKQRALVRQYSPENFSFLHTWKVLNSMSHNLSFALLLIVTISLVRFVQLESLDWLVLGCISLVSAIVFLYRATVYDKWHYHEMLQTIEVLELEKKAIKDSKAPATSKKK